MKITASNFIRFALVRTARASRATCTGQGARTVQRNPSRVSSARHGFPIEVFLRREAEWWQALLASYTEVRAIGR